ncbi:hypothetical protein GLOIN_2v1569739 [Rhizophagus irregularis DAOM 181602=DAOM 197198]|nr:hypothetical protein GLOIN_2v1569739 [Rhizophagus irregularis DAOM 181602=DAOM 197198]
MDFNSNNENQNKRNRYFNIIFLGIFLTEIIIYIIGIVILPIRSDWLIILVSVIFISGIYTFFKKTLFYLSAFCVVNMIQCIILIDFVCLYRYKILHKGNYFLKYVTKPNVFKKFYEDGVFDVLENEKKYISTFIIPNIIAIFLIIVFINLYNVLIFMTWKNEYWDFISRTKILIPNDKIKKSYIIYKFYNFLLYILLNLIVIFNLFDIYDIFSITSSNSSSTDLDLSIIIKAIKILSLFTLALSLKIIRKELKFGIFLIYGSLIVQGLCFYFWLDVQKYSEVDNMINMLSINNRMPALTLSRILGIILLGLTFVNTILCHLNFGKHHIFLLKFFNPNLDKEFEYLNDMDDDDDDDEEEEEKDEKISEKLNRYWKFIKKLSRIGQEH